MRIAGIGLALAVASAAFVACSNARHGVSVSARTGGFSSRGSTSSVTSPLSHEASSLLSEALAAFDDFPVTASPRPLVLTPPFGGRVNDPAGGFSAGDIAEADNRKTAYLQGSIQAPARLPDGPKSSQNYPIITAAEALQILKTPSGSGAVMPVPPLQVTSVVLGTSVFVTDRGRLSLPAWLFSFRDVANPAAVLAVAPPALYLHPASDFQSKASGVTWATAAEVSSSGHTITAEFAGSPAGSGPCTADYGLQIAASAKAVAVEVVELPRPDAASPSSTMPNMACALVGYPRQATAALPEALGNRVVVDADTRNPLAVTTTP